MRGKRTISAILIGAILASLLCLPVTAAQPELKLELRVIGQPQVGQAMTVELWCTDNPGLASVQMTLAYNERVLDCTGCSTGAALQGAMPMCNANGPEGAVIVAASATNIKRDGILATFAFNVLSEAACDFALRKVTLLSEDGTQIPFLVSGLNQSVGSGTGAAPSEPPAPVPTRPYFSDISGHWAEEYLNLSYERDLFAGYSDGTCHPDANVTRAEFVMVLYKNAGWPKVAKPSTFVDLVPGEYYLDAVAWAQHTGLVAGKGDNRFDPDASITREEVAVIIRKMSGDMTGSPFAYVYDQKFTDEDKMSSWGRDPVYWAIYNEVWCGSGQVSSGTKLNANVPATRAEIAVMMINYQDNVER